MYFSKIGRCAVFLQLAIGSVALAQVSTSTTGRIRGIVTDPSGAAVPGATLVAKDTSTSAEITVTSEKDGNYTFLSLQPGTYQLTVTMSGFQTAVYNGIVVDASRITDQPVTLTLGSVSNKVEVSGVAPVLETSSSQISTTVENKDIQDLPLSGRDTLPFATLMAGNQNIGTDSSAGRYGTFNGLPNASMNISLDGMNNNSQRFKSGGTSFFEFAPARLDAIQEVTVTSTGSGADASGDGAMQIQLVTKRGTEDYHFKVFEQFRNTDLNANSFFNNEKGLARTKVRQNDFGGNIGGPLPIPFVPYFKHRLFFFINFEATPLPTSLVDTATTLTPAAQTGLFSYVGSDGATHSLNVLQLATSKGFPGGIDPVAAGILNTTNGTLKGGVVTPSTTDLIHQTLTWNQPYTNNTYYPTARLDYQIAPKVAWHGVWNLRYNNITGYPQYPGLSVPGNAYKITTYVASNTVDWTIAPTILNSATFGIQSNGEYFYQGTNYNQWSAYGNRNIVFQPSTFTPAITSVVPAQTPFVRNNPVYQFRDNLSWLKGKHSLSFGASWLHSSFWESSYGAPGGGGIPNYTLGVSSSDPAANFFTTANFPSIRSADVANAEQLYAILTGRISSISSGYGIDENTKQYAPFSPVTQRFAYSTSGLYVQDSYHVTTSLTVNYGLRWEFTTPIRNTNNIDLIATYQNLFGPSYYALQPGILSPNQNPVLTQQSAAYSSDYKQPSPNFGFAWNPHYKSGWLGALLGHGTVIRGSYSINFYQEGMNAISNVMSSNGGSTQSQVLNPGQAGFTPGGLTLSSPTPALITNPSAFATTLPESDFTFANGVYGINPNLRQPYVQNWTFGIQRQVAPNTVFEARYVGNKATRIWHYYNVQETDIFHNGFLQEFENAQTNLAINQAAGVNSFGNRGVAGQTALPIMSTAFGSATSSTFTNGTFITDLQTGQAGAFAQSLATTTSYYCNLVGNKFAPCANIAHAVSGPYPINFFQPNPYGTNAFYQDDNGYSNYNALQLEVRKAYSKGFSFSANYTYSHTLGNMYNSMSQTAQSNVRTLANDRLDYGPTPFDIRHVFQAYWNYSLPIGKGRLVNVSNRFLDALVGGWTISGIHRITSGSVFPLTSNYLPVNGFTYNSLGNGGVVLNGITTSQLQGMFNNFYGNANKTVNFVDPNLIGPDGRANPAILAPATTPGQFGSFVYLYGPHVFSNDFSMSKEVPLTEKLHFGFQVEALNAFNHPIFSPVPTAGNSISITSTTFGQTSSSLIGPRQLQLRAFLQW
ncbi:MAG TPA: carboxypeptidase-like regulatory domain-containing protein [Bryobacteraceae bacterium]|nr:carboxypeptidase-like regulatory domain-containing protein [Bryobacteraceae bacterium]